MSYHNFPFRLTLAIYGLLSAFDIRNLPMDREVFLKVFGKGRKMIVIENIPFISCQNCGQTYITRDVMLRLDEIRTHSDTMTVPREVAYAKIA